MDLWALQTAAATNDSWLRDAGLVIVSSLLSGGLASWLTSRASRKQHRAEVVRTDVDRALQALAALRSAYRGRAFGRPFDELAIAEREDDLDLAAQRTTEAVVAAARGYVDVGRLYSVRDPDNGEGAEQQEYDNLTAALMAERKALTA